MYHALFEDGASASIDEEDRPYAVSRSDFTRQLDELAQKKVGLFDSNGSEFPELVISFDDGHESNLSMAAQLLAERGLAAYFFVTSDFIDQRAGFMSSSELAELSNKPGMCVGSHGVSHRFFDDLSASEARAELEQSRDKLADITGTACYSMSFPGGRFNRQTIDLLRETGFRQWFGSVVSIVGHSVFDQSLPAQADDRWSLAQQQADQPINRVAIRIGTQLEEFRKIINQDAAYFRRKKQTSQLKSAAQRILGNRLYHGLYQSVSRR